MIIGHLNITSYRGISFGAVHWYAKLHVAENHRVIENTELTRPLTAKEAVVLNTEMKAQGYGYDIHKPGEMTEGFNSEYAAIRNGIRTFKEKYPEGVLFKGDYVSASAWKNVIYFPPQHKRRVEAMELLAKEFQSLNGYECKPQFKKLVEMVDRSWYELYCQLETLKVV